MKKILVFLLCCIFCIDIIDSEFLNNEIYNYIQNDYFTNGYIISNSSLLSENEYTYKDYSSYVKTTDNFFPESKDDLLNLYYTALNNDYQTFFYNCSENYYSCLSDIENLSKDEETFSYLNQLVHPYNSFKTIESNYSNKGVNVTINKKYSQEDIKNIDNKLNDIINSLNINGYTSITDKIKVFHDYLASTNKYDKDKETGTSIYNSDTAIGTLFEGYSVCSGYSDAMSIFLSKLGLDNIKVATAEHVWNAVKIDDVWYHIDLTWDDPVTSNGIDIIQYDYFLITTSELLSKDDSHNFPTDIYDFLN